MIYSRQISQFKDLVLVQKPGSPSFVVRKSEVAEPQERKSTRISYRNRYQKSRNLFHFTEPDFVRMLVNEMVEKWRDAVEQLVELRGEIDNSSHLSPAIEATSIRAYITTVGWLVKLFSYDQTLPCPDIVPSGDGGIDIEWTLGDKFISVQIHASNPMNDRIFFKQGGSGFQPIEISYENLRNLLQG